jgi:hypothetical protein
MGAPPFRVRPPRAARTGTCAVSRSALAVACLVAAGALRPQRASRRAPGVTTSFAARTPIAPRVRHASRRLSAGSTADVLAAARRTPETRRSAVRRPEVARRRRAAVLRRAVLRPGVARRHRAAALRRAARRPGVARRRRAAALRRAARRPGVARRRRAAVLRRAVRRHRAAVLRRAARRRVARGEKPASARPIPRPRAAPAYATYARTTAASTRPAFLEERWWARGVAPRRAPVARAPWWSPLGAHKLAIVRRVRSVAAPRTAPPRRLRARRSRTVARARAAPWARSSAR